MKIKIVVALIAIVFGPFLFAAMLMIAENFGLINLYPSNLIDNIMEYSIPHIAIDYYHSYYIRQGYLSLAGSV